MRVQRPGGNQSIVTTVVPTPSVTPVQAPAPAQPDPLGSLTFDGVPVTTPGVGLPPSPLNRPSSSLASKRKAKPSGPSLLGPGLLIAIPYGLAILATLLSFVIVASNDRGQAGGQDLAVLGVVFGVLAVHYLLVLGGSIGMCVGCPRWLSIATCILGLLPTMLIGVPCLGFLIYPFALGGCIWGMVLLFGKASVPVGYAGSANPSPYRSSGGNTSASDYLRNAQNESPKPSSGDGPQTTVKAALCVVGGVACIGFACFSVFMFYRHMNGEVELRRPGRAISGAVIAGITGLGLLGQGINYFSSK
ncbi:hypothetical protein [Novipirellula artificiosorum]|nr:hypothetical protein [Novipirellula artificiosorum]